MTKYQSLFPGARGDYYFVKVLFQCEGGWCTGSQCKMRFLLWIVVQKCLQATPQEMLAEDIGCLLTSHLSLSHAVGWPHGLDGL